MSLGRASRGVILVSVLWCLTLLSALAMAASTTFRGFAGIIVVDRDRVRAEALLTAGLEVAAGFVGRLGEAPLLPREIEVALPGGRVRARLIDEGGRIDIGKAPPEVLASLLRHVGVRTPDKLVDGIIEARKPPPTPSGQPGPERDRPFASVKELRHAAGIPPEVVAAIGPLATVFGNATVNHLSAPGEVLAALPGADPRQLATFLAARSRPPLDADRLAALIGPARPHVRASPARAVSAHLVATLADGYARAAQAVFVVVPDDTQPYRLLAWDSLTFRGDDRS